MPIDSQDVLTLKVWPKPHWSVNVKLIGSHEEATAHFYSNAGLAWGLAEAFSRGSSLLAPNHSESTSHSLWLFLEAAHRFK